MKVKKCCNDYDKICLTNYIGDNRICNKVPSIWWIPEGCYEECGYSVEIKFCPFCGKKIEVEK